MEDDLDHCDDCDLEQYLDDSLVCKCPCHFVEPIEGDR